MSHSRNDMWYTGDRSIPIVSTPVQISRGITVTARSTSRALGPPIFDGTPGTGSPPATLGGYTMIPFPADPQGLVNVTTVNLPAPYGAQVITFSGAGAPPSHRQVPSSWATWSNGYVFPPTGDVYFTNGASSLTITFPPNTVAFYQYIEPNDFANGRDTEIQLAALIGVLKKSLIKYRK